MQTDPSNTSDYGFVPESHDDARLALRGSHHARRFGRNGPSFGKSRVFDLAWVYDRHVGPCGGRAASAIATPLMARARPMHLRAVRGLILRRSARRRIGSLHSALRLPPVWSWPGPSLTTMPSQCLAKVRQPWAEPRRAV